MPRSTTDTLRQFRRDDDKREKPELERRYGSIGISAVAAAARYHGKTDNPTLAPAKRNPAPKRKHAAA